MPQATASPPTTKGKPPEVDFQESGAKVAVWKFEQEGGGARYNLKLTFSYFDDANREWVETDYFSPTQAAVVAQLLTQAHAWVQADKRAEKKSATEAPRRR